jgi:hypothetical protein
VIFPESCTNFVAQRVSCVNVGLLVGDEDGCEVGWLVGQCVGLGVFTTPKAIGYPVGIEVGRPNGWRVGCVLGCPVGCRVGCLDGCELGCRDG